MSEHPKTHISTLFVTFNDVNDESYGGGQCSSRNLKALQALGTVESYRVTKKSGLASFVSALEGYFPPFSRRDAREIFAILHRGDYTCVFFDSSLFGSIAIKVRERFRIPVVCFFHNIESAYVDVRFHRGLVRSVYKYLAFKSESEIVKGAHHIIALNARDSIAISQLYKRRVESIVPITFDCSLNSVELQALYDENKDLRADQKSCLFVGSMGLSKFEGIRWFVQYVAPYLNAKVRIVGKGFDSVRDQLTGTNVEVAGFTEDLLKDYLDADCVVVPILSGAGMKVKVAEALMYGKTIFGTTEAFEGYDIDVSRVGGRCDLASDFIEKINRYLACSSRFNRFSREEYDTKYSNPIAVEKFSDILSSLEKGSD